MFIKFTKEELESFFGRYSLNWEYYKYQYADTLKAGEIAYAFPINKWCKIVLYSTLKPESYENTVGGTSGSSRGAGEDAIRFTVEYTNGKEIKAAGNYPRIYRRAKSKEVLFQRILGTLSDITLLAKEGFQKRCRCGNARPPVYKKIQGMDPWFLGKCLGMNCKYSRRNR